jgi:hypothetical protein
LKVHLVRLKLLSILFLIGVTLGLDLLPLHSGQKAIILALPVAEFLRLNFPVGLYAFGHFPIFSVYEHSALGSYNGILVLLI